MDQAHLCIRWWHDIVIDQQSGVSPHSIDEMPKDCAALIVGPVVHDLTHVVEVGTCGSQLLPCYSLIAAHTLDGLLLEEIMRQLLDSCWQAQILKGGLLILEYEPARDFWEPFCELDHLVALAAPNIAHQDIFLIFDRGRLDALIHREYVKPLELITFSAGSHIIVEGLSMLFIDSKEVKETMPDRVFHRILHAFRWIGEESALLTHEFCQIAANLEQNVSAVSRISTGRFTESRQGTD